MSRSPDKKGTLHDPAVGFASKRNAQLSESSRNDSPLPLFCGGGKSPFAPCLVAALSRWKDRSPLPGGNGARSRGGEADEVRAGNRRCGERFGEGRNGQQHRRRAQILRAPRHLHQNRFFRFFFPGVTFLIRNCSFLCEKNTLLLGLSACSSCLIRRQSITSSMILCGM